MVPPVTVRALSAWKPSSPVVIWKVPPVTVRSALEWTASSAASMVKLPPVMVRSPVAFSPLVLVEVSSVTAEVWVTEVLEAVVPEELPPLVPSVPPDCWHRF